jgi:(S)-2-hydroxyglutarate dehydrogenase
MSTTDEFDIAIVGAGIVGLAVTRELRQRHPDFRLILVERESKVGAHQTSHNSGVIHSGVYYKPGSLKARMCVEGSRLMYSYLDEHKIPYERCGKLIVAVNERQLPALDELEARGHANGVVGLRRLRGDEIAEVEPEARGIAALHSPNTGIVDYGLVALEIERELRAAGVEVRLGVDVTGVVAKEAGTELQIAGGDPITARMVITCAGLWSDRVAVAAGAPKDPRIVPFRGGYLQVRQTAEPFLRGLVYPVPDPDLPFLGVHVSKHMDGSVSLGPTALLVLARDAYRITKVRPRDVLDTFLWGGTWRLATHYWKTAITELRLAFSTRAFINAAAIYVPKVKTLGVAGALHSGVRAQALAADGTLVDDFVISETPGALHVRNAPSPAATSSFALAKELANRVEASESWSRLKR